MLRPRALYRWPRMATNPQDDPALQSLIGIAESADAALRSGTDQRESLDLLDAEQEAMGSALKSAPERGFAEEALRLAGALAFFWWLRGHARQGRAWLEQLIPAAPAAALPVRAKAFEGLGLLLTELADDSAGSVLEQALVMWRVVADDAGMARSMRLIGILAWWLGDIQRAQGLLEEALQRARDGGDAWTQWAVLHVLGEVLAAEDPNGARDVQAEALEKARLSGDPIRIHADLYAMGALAEGRGDLEEARAFYADALAIADELALPRFAVSTRLALARVVRKRGGAAEAATALERLLNEAQGSGSAALIATCQAELARTCLARGDGQRARRLMTEALSSAKGELKQASLYRRRALVRTVDEYQAELAGMPE